MKSRIVKTCMLFLFFAMVAAEADAQRTGRRRNNEPSTQPQEESNEQQQNNNNRQPSGYDPYGGIPIVVDSSGMSDTAQRKSMRNDAAYDKTGLNDRTPLPYEHLRWDDALYTERVWRELDLREKMNKVFQYEADDDNGSQMFVNILLRAVQSGEITAFADDRFSQPLSLEEVQGMTLGAADTVPQVDPNDPSKVIRYVVTRASFDAKSINKIAMKEDWVFDREASRMFVRILGLAPLQTRYLPNGQEMGQSVMFWIYYPDIRALLAKYEVYNPKNMGMGRMTWEELFESRMFSSYIVKSTLDNPTNKPIRTIYKDPILSLLEGENIKEKIFNYEQDLWSY